MSIDTYTLQTQDTIVLEKTNIGGRVLCNAKWLNICIPKYGRLQQLECWLTESSPHQKPQRQFHPSGLRQTAQLDTCRHGIYVKIILV